MASPRLSYPFADRLASLRELTFLITGADGMLGRAFREVLRGLDEEIRVHSFPRQQLDVTDHRAVMAAADLRPHVILHCGGLALADRCEREPALAYRSHVEGTRNVALLARATGARVFYPQSVFIFDGLELPVTESTTPAPSFVYGRAKLDAERLLVKEVAHALIVRMAGFFGGDEKDKNFVGLFVRQLEALLRAGGGTLDVGDRMWQPTYTIDLARNTLLLIALEKHGVYHMGAVGEASFFDVAQASVEELGVTDVVRLRRVPSTAFDDAEPARRPRRMVTANARLEAEGLCWQRPWRAALSEYLQRPYFDRIRHVGVR
jgi:dTDP-4-dehydrorhamnose reductase